MGASEQHKIVNGTFQFAHSPGIMLEEPLIYTYYDESEPHTDDGRPILLQNELVTVYTIFPGWFNAELVYAKPNIKTFVYYPNGKKYELLQPGPHWIGGFKLSWVRRLTKGGRSPAMVIEIDTRRRTLSVKVSGLSADKHPVSLVYHIYYRVEDCRSVLEVADPIEALHKYAVHLGAFVIKSLPAQELSRNGQGARFHDSTRRNLLANLNNWADKIGLTVFSVALESISLNAP